ncbi:MAG TPA: TrmH family RNA methyltransferase, partial [Exilispira sp.]|nr:TrmH family RNA methyltransferase [Exilispira sp.]
TIEKNLLKLIFYTQKYNNYFDYIEKIKRLIFTGYLFKMEGSKLTIESKSYMQLWNILIEKNREELYQILISLRQGIILNENMSNFESDFTNYISYDETHVVKSRLNLSVILDNIRSPFNAGSIIRSAESFCFEKVIMTGITTMIPENKIFRSSMGAENFIEILKYNNIKDCINYLRNENYKIYVLEKKKDSISLWDSAFEDKIALVVGNEEFGVDDDFISDADFYISIPQNGVKNSLNVSSAFAIAASWIFKSNAQIL